MAQSWDDVCEVAITAPDGEWLQRFLHGLVCDRLAASAHLVGAVSTVYRWEGEVHEATEARGMIRTRRALVGAIVERARALHPYVVPSVVAVPLVGGNPDYLAWITAQTDEPAPPPARS